MDLWRCLNLSRLYHAHLLLLLNRYTIYLLSVMPPHQHRYGVLDISIFQSFPYCRCVQFIWFVRSFNGTNSSEILCDSLRYSANMLSSHIITKSNWDNGKNSISIELYCLGVRQSFKWKYLSLSRAAVIWCDSKPHTIQSKYKKNCKQWEKIGCWFFGVDRFEMEVALKLSISLFYAIHFDDVRIFDFCFPGIFSFVAVLVICSFRFRKTVVIVI